ncbi:MAG: oxidoreductase [Labilithrix sp.]|nr:oxidoreductase [Labilithrix sp.]
MTMRIDVHADVLCPWSYIAKRRLEAARAGIQGTPVEIVWRSFELAPDLGSVPAKSAAQTIRDWRGDEADARIARIVALGAAEGITLDLERARLVNTFDAHRLLHLGAAGGKADAVMERLLRAYHSDGENVADAGVLARLGRQAGLDAQDVTAMLAGERCSDAVRADQDLARRRGITGVPMMVIGPAPPISAVRPVDELRELLERAAAGSR